MDFRLVLTNFYLGRVKHKFLTRHVSSSQVEKNISKSNVSQDELNNVDVS